MQIKIALIITLVSLVGASVYFTNTAWAQSTNLPSSQPTQTKPSFIRKAMHELEQTKEGLQKSAKSLGGHREAAIKDIDAAIAELRQAQEIMEKNEQPHTGQ